MLSRLSFPLAAVFLSAIFMSATVHAQQLNPMTNSYDPVPPDAVQLPAATPAGRGTPGIACDSSTFFVVNPSEIRAFTLNGSTVSGYTVVLSGIQGRYANLAVCNNLNGGSFSPTFYTDNASGSVYSPAYYDGSNIVVTPASYPSRLYNAGGNGDFLYYQAYPNSQLIELVRYDGNTVTHLYTTPPGKTFGVSDLAVDDSGNVVFVTESGFFADSIIVLSPTGQIVHQYAFSYNTIHAYGCFLMNGIYYIALGESNPTSPNTLLPVTLTGSSAIIGTPIPFANDGYQDMATCGQQRQGCPPFTFSNTVSVTRAGLSTGAIKAVVSGGTPPYQYSLDNNAFQSSNIFNSLGVGIYQLYVTDSSGCTGQQTFLIEEAGCCGQ